MMAFAVFVVAVALTWPIALLLMHLAQDSLYGLPPLIYTMVFLASLPFAIRLHKSKNPNRGGWSAVLALIGFLGSLQWIWPWH